MLKDPCLLLNLAKFLSIDRSTWVNKSKPNHERPQVEGDDDNSEIYEGEEFSVKESDFHNDHTEEFYEVEEVYQSINTSMLPDAPIQEVSQEDESSNEVAKHKEDKISNHKNISQFNDVGNNGIQHKDDEIAIIPETTNNFYSKITKSISKNK